MMLKTRVRRAPRRVWEMLEARCLFSGVAPHITGHALPLGRVVVSLSFQATLAQFSNIPLPVSGNPASNNPSINVNWGDGSASDIITGFQIDAGGNLLVTDGHTYSNPGTFHVITSFYEKGRLKAHVKSRLSVTAESAGGVAVNATVNQPLTNVTVATFSGVGSPYPASDPGGGVSIQWADEVFTNGTVTDTGNGVYAISGSHTYSVSGVYPITVEGFFLQGSAGSYHTIVSSAVVRTANGTLPKPHAIAIPQTLPTALAGVGFGAPILAEFTGIPQLANAYSATIRWGDRSQPTVSNATSNPATFAPGSDYLTFSDLGHLYPTAGRFNVEVRLDFNGHFVGRVIEPVLVKDRSASGLALRAVAGQAFSGTIGAFQTGSMDGPLNIPAGTPSQVIIDWGDGTTSDGTLATTAASTPGQPAYAVGGTHVYGRPGHYRILALANYAGLAPSPDLVDQPVIDSTMAAARV